MIQPNTNGEEKLQKQLIFGQDGEKPEFQIVAVLEKSQQRRRLY